MSEIVPFRTPEERSAALPRVVSHLQSGGIIAYPTETVYGFGTTLESRALAALQDLKGGRENKSFLLLLRGRDDACELRWTAEALKLAECFWPGPLTIALAVERGDYPAQVLSSAGTVAVRVSPHDGVQEIVRALGGPITSTSANLPGQPPATSAEQVAQVLTGLAAQDTLILDGGQIDGVTPSTIVDCSHGPPQIVRVGVIPIADIERCLYDLRP